MSELATHPDLWTRYVPVVFHVDYWDRLGWKDPFASSTYTRRQYAYAAYHRMRSVYTPGFFINGKEWKGFFEQTKLPVVERNQVTLSGTWNQGSVNISISKAKNNPIYHAVVLGSGFVTSIKRGENAGRRLQGDFTVLAYKIHRPKKTSHSTATIEFKSTDLAQTAPRLGFAIWCTEGSSPLPVAAAGSWLPKDAFK